MAQIHDTRGAIASLTLHAKAASLVAAAAAVATTAVAAATVATTTAVAATTVATATIAATTTAVAAATTTTVPATTTTTTALTRGSSLVDTDGAAQEVGVVQRRSSSLSSLRLQGHEAKATGAAGLAICMHLSKVWSRRAGAFSANLEKLNASWATAASGDDDAQRMRLQISGYDG
jgi:hypothetical protein